MPVPSEDVKRLRDLTGAGMLDCKKALEAAEQVLGAGATKEQIMERAKDDLRKKGFEAAARRAERVTAEGVVQSYIHHNNRLGVLVELNCESDFVARTEDFRRLAQQVALQVAGANPLYVSPEEMTDGAKGDPKQLVLLLQQFVQDESRTVQDLVNETISKTGENIRIRRFARFELGQYGDGRRNE